MPSNEYHKFEALEDTIAYEIYWVELNEKDIIREIAEGDDNKEASLRLIDQLIEHAEEQDRIHKINAIKNNNDPTLEKAMVHHLKALKVLLKTAMIGILIKWVCLII